jgi:hypothetical protein
MVCLLRRDGENSGVQKGKYSKIILRENKKIDDKKYETKQIAKEREKKPYLKKK